MKELEMLKKTYEQKLHLAENELELVNNMCECVGSENEEEAEFLTEKANKNLIVLKQRVFDLREFLVSLNYCYNDNSLSEKLDIEVDLEDYSQV